jgi:hypothetical protein
MYVSILDDGKTSNTGQFSTRFCIEEMTRDLDRGERNTRRDEAK